MSARLVCVPLTTMVFGILLGFLLSAVVTYMMPKRYESECIIQIRPGTGDVPGVAQPNANHLAAQLHVMTSRQVLERVVRSLELVESWNADPETCMQSLASSLQIATMRGTDLVSIMCRHTSKVDARDIANEVAMAYRTSISEQAQAAQTAYLQELNIAVREQEDKVAEKQAVLNSIIRARATATAPTEPPSGANGISRGSGPQYATALRELETENELLKTMKLQQIAKRIDAKIPGEQVIIHNEAVIPIAPASPRVTLNLMIGTGGGLVAGAMLGLALMPVLGSRSSLPAKAYR